MKFKKIVSALALLTVFSSSALAVDVPVGSRYDSRIQYVNYNPADITLVRSLPGLGNRVIFSPDEVILDIASGFTQGWQFFDRRNHLFIKPISIKSGDTVFTPKKGQWDTNLMVTTNKRVYDFELRLIANANEDGTTPNTKGVAYRVEFRYPGEERAKAQSKLKQQETELKLSGVAPPMNWNYSMQIGKASQDIAPAMAYDDGRFTYLRFPNNRAFPTAFLVAADKSESIVDSHIDPKFPDVLVLHRVNPQFVLRLGNAVVGVYNDSYDPDGLAPVNGTTVPGVSRTIKSQGDAK